ncbi:MAG: hypothetical protein WBF34_26390 [Streptosporangiaceae bacterium]|jgi:hypothetical protein
MLFAEVGDTRSGDLEDLQADKGDDPDYGRWVRLDTPRAWERLGNGEELPTTGQSPGLIAGTRCQDCVSHRPW